VLILRKLYVSNFAFSFITSLKVITKHYVKESEKIAVEIEAKEVLKNCYKNIEKIGIFHLPVYIFFISRFTFYPGAFVRPLRVWPALQAVVRRIWLACNIPPDYKPYY